MNVTAQKKAAVVRKFLQRKISKKEAVGELRRGVRTVERYAKRFLERGPEGLVDRRGGNNQKLTAKDRRELVRVKKEGPWRSARKVRDMLKLPAHESTVWRVWVAEGVNRLNYKQIKPIRRFVAECPNDLWQADIMGKVRFSKLGVLYLIATLDDHARSVLSGKWFRKQTKINVFRVWYYALRRYGLPKAMLQDKGSQYKAHKGQADYQHYANLLGIGLIYANRAQTKGKIERFWRFVQQDFVRENLDVESVEELNDWFFAWQKWYNTKHHSSGLGMSGRTPNEVYYPSGRRKDPRELRALLTIEERRKVMRDSTISLYGERYRIPPGYINCRIWVKIVGDWLIFEAMDKVIWKQRLKA